MPGKRNKILVIGASGQVGSHLVHSLQQSLQFDAIAAGHGDLDIGDIHSINRCLNHEINAVVNCAAYTAVDAAESNQTLSWSVNALGPKLLAQRCQSLNIPLIHYSSDYVYHNGQHKPLPETAPCNPKSIYAISKYLGEQDALYYHHKTIILRTSWVYADQGNNFVNTIRRLAQEKPKLQVVNDQFGGPTYTPDLVQATIEILKHLIAPAGSQCIYGIYNFANQGAISWYEFAKEIVRLTHQTCEVESVPSSAFPRPAPRPDYSVFDLSKIVNTFNLDIPRWDISLARSLSVKEKD